MLWGCRASLGLGVDSRPRVTFLSSLMGCTCTEGVESSPVCFLSLSQTQISSPFCHGLSLASCGWQQSVFFWKLLEFKELLGKGLTLDSRCKFSLDTMSSLSAPCRKLIPNRNKDMPGWLVIEPPMDTMLSYYSVGIRKRLENCLGTERGFLVS